MRADARINREKILAAAEEVFAEHGATASTEEVATRAGVAIGTVFRHFPTKAELLQAVMKRLLADLLAQAEEMAAGDEAEGLFVYFTRTVEQAARKRTVIDLLSRDDSGFQVADAVVLLHDGVQTLLLRSQRAGAVRPEVRADEVIALLGAVCQGAVHGAWNDDLRHRTLTTLFQGLAP